MTDERSTTAPGFVVVSGGADHGRVIRLDLPRVRVGRSAGVDVRFADQRVSGQHAELWQLQNSVFLTDLNSTSGTFLNDVRVTGTSEVRQGDLVDIGPVRLRYQGIPAGRSRAAVEFHNAGPHFGPVNQVGRDQHIQYILQQRASFLQEVAATKSKARWLVWLGLGTFLVGLAMFASQILGFIGTVGSNMGSGRPDLAFSNPFGVVTIAGWGLGAGGSIMIVIGIVLHVVSTSRRRQLDTRYPLPQPGHR